MGKPRVLWVGNSFLVPLLAPDCEIVPCGEYTLREWHGGGLIGGSKEQIHAAVREHASECDLLLSMDTAREPRWFGWACEAAKEVGLRTALWNIEDPNSFGAFWEQCAAADYLFTTCRSTLARYRERLGHSRVYWLPLAAQPALHEPRPLAEDAADFVYIGNHYPWWPAKVAFLEQMLLPLVRAGYSLALFSYEAEIWPEEIRPFWRGRSSYLDSAECYRHGRVALGANCQAGGAVDRFAGTTMTSMRTFEALACEKPLLAFFSEAYAALGLKTAGHGPVHLAMADAPSLAKAWADFLTRDDPRPRPAIGESYGREFILSHHTYAHRLARIQRALNGAADPEDYAA